MTYLPPQISSRAKAIRWTAAAKREVISRIARGELTELGAHALYGASPEELASWRRAFNTPAAVNA